jgi:phosphoribosyl-AMP cyclohydrolase
MTICRLGVYQSRKRGLWYKGATSGDTQELVKFCFDCDQDCLKFVVKQKGRGKISKLLYTGNMADLE